MKKIYECPTIEIVALKATDIIVMSELIENGQDVVLKDYNQL